MPTLINNIIGIETKLDEKQYPVDIPAYLIAREAFRDVAKAMKANGARLAAEWAADETLFARGFGIYACYEKGGEYLIIKASMPIEDATFPSLTKKFVSAYRFERQINSLMGVVPVGHPDLRPWIRHEDWQENVFPLRKSFDASKRITRVKGRYPWITVGGEGVYEIPVGPVHAGIIEPGHFRFSAVGENVLNLEARLGYTHKGIEKRFESLSWEQGARLAGRVSGDTTVAHSLTYCRTVEAMSECHPPERALWLRALMLERERIANHLWDIGAIAGDVGFAFMFYQMSMLKERIMRTNHQLFGHRFMMDRIMPGGVTIDLTQEGRDVIISEMNWLSKEFERLVIIYDRNSSITERLLTTGILLPDEASELGVVGFVARASGQRMDCRVQNPFTPYDQIIPKMTVLESGDVYARAWVRIEEIRESIRIIREILNNLPNGNIAVSFNQPSPDRAGIAIVEGWRGEVVYWIQSGLAGEISRCMVRDPSSVNWLALERAIIGNIVPDFPVCNKSFNQSYSGCDL
jgi:Ni,Fe-hydrogenase III large subunit/Ni,Fe-hydrogenase III component G